MIPYYADEAATYPIGSITSGSTRIVIYAQVITRSQPMTTVADTIGSFINEMRAFNAAPAIPNRYGFGRPGPAPQPVGDRPPRAPMLPSWLLRWRARAAGAPA